MLQHFYSNKNINKELSHLNYSLKECEHSYEKEFELIKERYKLKGQIKSVSNIVCEYIIISDKEFFNSILRKVIKTFEKTLNKFIHWVCKKFSVSEEEDFIRDFQRETDTYINPERQIKYEQELEYDELEW